RSAIATARAAKPDAVVGLGGGSPLDVAKLVAAFANNAQDLTAAWGINQLTGGRSLWLACLPTTAGTGSEVSPNAILHDESANLKKGIISPALMPDAAYVDPQLTVSLPPAVTAATGLDALVHCIEAYANKFAHPMIDLYALEGIRRIGRSIVRAVEHGDDLDARSDMALGSLYGGICLGPVNTGAVHALSYPLGSEFKIAHGVANALLLPHVIAFNNPAAPERYATIAAALGTDDLVARLFELVKQCGVPSRLRDVGIGRDAFDRMARNALTITRLLDRNVRGVTYDDAMAIYEKAY
ncbi:iron-containing alcohol dehydrogenase, partial [bacterium]